MSANDLRQTCSQRLKPQWHQPVQRESLRIHYEWGRPDFGNLGGCVVHVSKDRFSSKGTGGGTQFHITFLFYTGISVSKTHPTCHCLLSRIRLTVLLEQCWANYSSSPQLMFRYAHKQKLSHTYCMHYDTTFAWQKDTRSDRRQSRQTPETERTNGRWWTDIQNEQTNIILTEQTNNFVWV